MLFLIKNRDYFYEIQTPYQDTLLSSQSHQLSLRELIHFIDEKIYLNIFLQDIFYLEFLGTYPLGSTTVYVLMDTISYIPYHLRIKSQIIMEDKNTYTLYFPEIQKFLADKNYIINIPSYLQKGVLRAFIIDLLRTIKNKNLLLQAVVDMRNIFFYKDHKICLQMLYIWHKKMNFIED